MKKVAIISIIFLLSACAYTQGVKKVDPFESISSPEVQLSKKTAVYVFIACGPQIGIMEFSDMQEARPKLKQLEELGCKVMLIMIGKHVITPELKEGHKS